jgi:hypothetical protein
MTLGITLPAYGTSVPAFTEVGEPVDVVVGGEIPDGMFALAQGEDLIVVDFTQFYAIAVGFLQAAADAGFAVDL